MLYISLEFLEQRVNKQLSLQELFLFNRAIKQALELEVPEEVSLEFLAKEMEVEVLGKVLKDRFKAFTLEPVPKIPYASVEELEVLVESVDYFVEDLGVLFSEQTYLEFVVCYSL